MFELISPRERLKTATGADNLRFLRNLFQVELSDALLDKEALERLPDAALNRLDLPRWEKLRADRMIECRR